MKIVLMTGGGLNFVFLAGFFEKVEKDGRVLHVWSGLGGTQYVVVLRFLGWFRFGVTRIFL